VLVILENLSVKHVQVLVQHVILYQGIAQLVPQVIMGHQVQVVFHVQFIVQTPINVILFMVIVKVVQIIGGGFNV
jgi:hypothetical protein